LETCQSPLRGDFSPDLHRENEVEAGLGAVGVDAGSAETGRREAAGAAELGEVLLVHFTGEQALHSFTGFQHA